MDYMDDDELISRYRLPRECIFDLCDQLAAELQQSTLLSCALSVTTQILVALRFYATGSMQRVAGDLHGISQSAICLSLYPSCSHTMLLPTSNFLQIMLLSATILIISTKLQHFLMYFAVWMVHRF